MSETVRAFFNEVRLSDLVDKMIDAKLKNILDQLSKAWGGEPNDACFACVDATKAAIDRAADALPPMLIEEHLKHFFNEGETAQLLERWEKGDPLDRKVIGLFIDPRYANALMRTLDDWWWEIVNADANARAKWEAAMFPLSVAAFPEPKSETTPPSP